MLPKGPEMAVFLWDYGQRDSAGVPAWLGV